MEEDIATEYNGLTALVGGDKHYCVSVDGETYLVNHGGLTDGRIAYMVLEQGDGEAMVLEMECGDNLIRKLMCELSGVSEEEFDGFEDSEGDDNGDLF